MQVEIKGGEKWEKVLDQISRMAAEDGTAKVGFLEGATYPDGEPVADRAARNEYGAPGIPPRPFFRLAIRNNISLWPGMIGTIAKIQRFDVYKVLGQMSEIIKGEVQLEILKMQDPPNSPETIAKKGFNKPLIDTAHMLNSVDYEINMGEKPSDDES